MCNILDLLIHRSNDVLNLLVYGKYNLYDFRIRFPYYIKRQEAYMEVEKSLESKKICIVHSNFGNGKTIFLDYLASQLVEENNVYILKNVNYLQEDLRIIRRQRTVSNIILVDDYDLYVEIFKELSLDFPDNIKIIATSRTSLSDLLIDRLVSDYHFSLDNDIGIVNIEIISDEDRKQLIKSFPDRRTIENSDLCANSPKKL